MNLDSELALSYVAKDSRVSVSYYKLQNDEYTELTDGVVIPNRDAYTTPSSGTKMVYLKVTVSAGGETNNYFATLTAGTPKPTPTPG